MIPDKSHPVWKKVVFGQKPLTSSQLGLQMLLKRISTRITPASPAADVQAAIEELHNFFTKFERILVDEIKSLGV